MPRREPSSAKDQILAAALAAGATHQEAGRAAGVSERTVRRRVATPEFHQRLSQAKVEYVGQITTRLTGLASHAVETLSAMLADPDVAAAVKSRTALAILATSKVWREDTELEGRLLLLEDHLGGQGRNGEVQ